MSIKRPTGIWVVASAVLIVAATYFIFDRTHGFYKVYWTGQRLYEQGKFVQALSYLSAAHRLNPNDKVVAWKLVWTYQHLGREDEGRRVLEDINARSPADPKVSESLGDMAYSTKSYAAAERYYQRVLAKNPTPQIRKKLIDALIGEKKYDQAINQMDILLAAAPSDQELRYQHAKVISAAGDHERSARELRALIEDGFNKKEALTMLADELRMLGRDEEAIRIYQGVNNGQ